MLWLRWPMFFVPYHLNVDESSSISQSITLSADPIYWRSVTAGTSGPANIYPRLIPHLLGFQDNYFTSRCMALLVACMCLTVFYLILHGRVKPPLDRLAVLVVAAFWGLTTHGDFTHWSSEHLPILFILIGILALLRFHLHSFWGCFLAGVAIGTTPMAKLQGVVPAAALSCLCLWFIATSKNSIRSKARSAIGLIAGGVTPFLIFLTLAISTNQLGHFFQSYIVMNVGYTEAGMRISSMLPILLTYAAAMPDFMILFIPTLFLGIASWLACRKSGERARKLTTIFSVLLPVSIYTALAPGRPFPHYFLFSLFPLIGWAVSIADMAVISGKITMRVMVTMWLLLLATQIFGSFLITKHPMPGYPMDVRGNVFQFISPQKSELSQMILSNSDPNKPMSVWGWVNELHVETGKPRGTSDTVLEYLWNITPDKAKGVTNWIELVPSYFKELYLSDMQRTKPDIFVDAVAPGAFIFSERSVFGHEAFAELAEFIRANYTQLADIDGVRVFKLKE